MNQAFWSEKALGIRAAFVRKAGSLAALEKRACPSPTSGTRRSGKKRRNGGIPTTQLGDLRGKGPPAGQGR